MSDYHGDILAGTVLRFTFPTALNGAPLTLAGSPTLACYKDGGTTEVATGLTLTLDFDGKTGTHQVVADTSSDATFYAAGHEYALLLVGGTVSGVSVTGTPVGQFSIQNRYMRGTDSAALATSLAALIATVGVAGAGLTAADDAVISALSAISSTLASGVALTSGERNSVATALLDLSNGVETGITLRQAVRLELAALAGKLSGAATETIEILDATGSKPRITATVDSDGNRTAVTLDAS